MMFFICMFNLRSIPNKLGGVIMLFTSTFILFLMPLLNNNKMKNLKFYSINQFLFWLLINIFIMLTWLVMQTIEYPFTNLNNIFNILYFSYFIFSFMLNNMFDFLMKVMN